MSFYEQMLKICNQEGISPTRIAEDVGLTSKSATGWKNGSVPRKSTLKAIADRYGVTVDWLMSDDPMPIKWDSKKESSEYLPLSSADKFILDMYHELDGEGQRRYMQMCMRVNDEEMRRMKG